MLNKQLFATSVSRTYPSWTPRDSSPQREVTAFTTLLVHTSPSTPWR